MKKLVFVTAIALAIVFMAAGVSFAKDAYFAQEYTGSVNATYWVPSITGSFTTGNANSNMDFKNALGLSNSGAFMADMKYKYDNLSSFFVRYFGVGNTGGQTSPSGFMFRNITFGVNDNTTSTLNVKMADFVYERKLSESESSYLCGLIGIKYGSFRLNVTNVTRGNSSAGAGAKGVMPEIGLYGKTKLTQNIDGVARILFFNGTSGSQNGGFVDLDAGFNWEFYPNWSCDLGYKWFQLTGTNTNTQDKVNINYGGPFLGFRYSY